MWMPYQESTGLATVICLLVTPERILIIEDDDRIGSTLVRALEGAGFEAHWEQTGQAGIDLVATRGYALVLLDLGLPDMDGLAACRKIHDLDPLTDVIILTARDEELDIVVGLDAGAIDYVTKPFKLAELLARIRAQLRRSDPRPSAQSTFGDLRIDVDARRVWIGTDEVTMRAKEFDLLSRLVEDAGSVISRDELMRDVWDENWFSSTKTLDFHIAAVRRKIDAVGQPSRITTLRGVGYRFELL
jgi:DNA-binding response OmpR family regulator